MAGLTKLGPPILFPCGRQFLVAAFDLSLNDPVILPHNSRKGASLRQCTPYKSFGKQTFFPVSNPYPIIHEQLPSKVIIKSFVNLIISAGTTATQNKDSRLA